MEWRLRRRLVASELTVVMAAVILAVAAVRSGELKWLHAVVPVGLLNLWLAVGDWRDLQKGKP